MAGASFNLSTSKLLVMAESVARLNKSFIRDCNQLIAEDMATRVIQCFETSRDPYGVPWPPLKSRKGQPLLKTGRLRSSIHGSYSAGSFGVATSVKYGAVHNYGYPPGNIPKRQYIPGRGMPKAWRAVAVDIFRKQRNVRLGR